MTTSGDARQRDHDVLVGCVTAALRAPSVYNAQPWRWRIRGHIVDLFADPDRHLSFADPEANDLLLSCGAALQHLLVALAAAGRGAGIERLPDPEDRHHLARVRVGVGRPDPDAARLAPAVAVRCTDRRRFAATEVDPATLAELIGVAARYGTTAVKAEGPQRSWLIDMLAAAAVEQRRTPGYAAEVTRWAGRYRGAHDGIDVAAVARAESAAQGGVPMRLMPGSALAQPPVDVGHRDGSALVVLAAARGSRADVLRAGEATSAVLLSATLAGLVTTPLSQPMEVTRTRHAIAARMIDPALVPLLILRVGHAVAGCATLPRHRDAACAPC